MNEEVVAKLTLDAAFAVHRELGPGLLESVHECAMAAELRHMDINVERQVAIPVCYRGVQLEIGFRADMIVEQCVLVELKSVEAIQPVFKQTTLTYLRLIPLRLGFLINFNASLLKEGITRIVHQLPDSNYPSSRSLRPSRDPHPVL